MRVQWFAGLVALFITGAVAAWALRTPAAPAIAAANASANIEEIVFGMGCFWGAEKRMSEVPGVLEVEAGYAGGESMHASYAQVLATERAIAAGLATERNHAEVVKVRYDSARIDVSTLLSAFWENHDPTQKNAQGNDIGSNYRSAIYFTTARQEALSQQSRKRYQAALRQAGYGDITTEIAPLKNYTRAEEAHQNYLVKHPDGYCGLGGTGVRMQGDTRTANVLDGAALNSPMQLVVYESDSCPYCERFAREVLVGWKASVPMLRTRSTQPPAGWVLNGPLVATPTMVLFKQRKEVARYTGYTGDAHGFWKWLGVNALTPEQQTIALDAGTETAYTGPYLGEHRRGLYVDALSGAPLFRSDAKFDSGCGWPSFFEPVPGALEFKPDTRHGMQRVEVRAVASGIHLGHVFDDGPPPTYKRYCINGAVLRFVPDTQKSIAPTTAQRGPTP